MQSEAQYETNRVQRETNRVQSTTNETLLANVEQNERRINQHGIQLNQHGAYLNRHDDEIATLQQGQNGILLEISNLTDTLRAVSLSYGAATDGADPFHSYLTLFSFSTESDFVRRDTAWAGPAFQSGRAF